MARTATATSRDMQLAREKARGNYIKQYGVSPPANAQLNITATSGGLYKADISVPDPTAMEAVEKDDVGGAGLDEGDLDLKVAAEELGVAPGVQPEVQPEVQPSGANPHLEIIQEAIERAVGNGLPRLSVALIDSVMQQESGAKHIDADGNIITSGSGARGIMQLMPGTASEMGLDPDDLAQNIYGGVEYLAKMQQRAQDKYGLRGQEAVEAALAMYNFGPTAYDQSLKGERATPTETEEYPGQVLDRLGDGDAAAAATDGLDEGEIDEETLAQALRGPASDVPLVYRMDQREEKPSRADVEKKPFIGPRQRDLGPLLDPLPLKNVFEVAAEEPVVDPGVQHSGPAHFARKKEIDYQKPDLSALHFIRQRDIDYKPVDKPSEHFRRKDEDREIYDVPGFPYKGGGQYGGRWKKPPAVVEAEAEAEKAQRERVARPETPLPSLKRAGSLAVPDTTTMPLDLQGMEPGAEAGGMQTQAEAGGPSFLSRLGGAIKDNPMIAAQIAQVVGGIGSGVLGGRRMAKEQAKGARRQREAMNMANAISTLTRGRTQPAVAPRPVISKPGGAETIFDILGTLGQGGAQITQGIQQREEAAEDRRRQQEMEDFRKEYLTRGQDIEQSEVDRKRQADSDGGEGGGEAGFTPINRGQATLIRDTLNDLKAMHAKGGPGTTGYFSWDRKFFGPAKEQADFRNTAGMIIGPIKDVMGLGRLTREDLALVLKTLPAVDDTRSQVEGKIDGILSLVDWVEKQDRRGVPMPSEIRSKLEQHSGGATGVGAPTGTGGKFGVMSNEDLAAYIEHEPPHADVEQAIEAEAQR